MFTYEKKTQDLINNERIAYIEKGDAQEVILLIHGNMASSVHMLSLMNKLSHKYRVIAPDLRGFGDSSFNNTYISLKELAFDLLLLMDELKIKEAHVLGWSTGFGVALELAILKPNLVKSLFSLQGMPVTGYYSLKKDKEDKIISHRLYSSYQEMLMDKELNSIHYALLDNNKKLIELIWRKTLLLYNELSDVEIELYVKETLKQKTQDIINWAWVNFNISNEANLYTKGTSEINQIKCPIFISYSQKDNIVTKEMVDINIKAFPNAKVFTIENGGHCVHLEDLDNISEIILNAYAKIGIND